MYTITAYTKSTLYYVAFGISLVVFDLIQRICLRLGGYHAHKKSVDILNFLLVQSLRILGTKVTFRNPYKLPENAPLIIACNHQSMNDIPPCLWFFRKHHPKFVAKKELGKGIPSISYNLKHGGAALIDRKDAKQSISAIVQLGKYLEKNHHAAIIYPEGTRSRNGVPKRFSPNGLKMLVKHAPSAYVVPVTINNSWRLVEKGGFPMGTGVHLSLDVHEPIKADSMDFDTLFARVEREITSAVIG
ncbi:MAG: lysophospholipid acyltransferase family protein [Lutibacter sp.]|nr:lysophospholipid acyltransferase family protein [Lutibacter sp.]